MAEKSLPLASIEDRFFEFMQRYFSGGDCHQFEFHLFANYLLEQQEPF